MRTRGSLGLIIVAALAAAAVLLAIVCRVTGFQIRLEPPTHRSTSAYSPLNVLRQVQSGKEQAALAYGLKAGETVSVWQVNEFINTKRMKLDEYGAAKCPETGCSIIYNPIGSNPVCPADGKRIRPRALIIRGCVPCYDDGVHRGELPH